MTAASGLPEWRRNLTLALIALVSMVSLLDRQIFGIFIPQIGADLGLDHAELGFVAGISFSLFYILAAFPIARWADRGDRPLIVALCVTVWSLATAACALAGSMWQLVMLRVGLAAGEGGAGPASQSLLLDIFQKERRTLVLGTLLAANSIGLGAGGLIGGWLSQSFTWRESLVVVGLPGVLLGLAVWGLAAEPRRAGQAFTAPPRLPMREVARTILGNPSLRWVALTIIFVASAGFPYLIWSGAFYQTVHGMSVKEAGEALFLPISGGLVVGNLLAGWLGDRFGRGEPKYYGRLAAAGLVVAFPLGIAAAQLTSPGASLVLFFLFQVTITLHLAPMQALAFAQVGPAMRAMLGASIAMVIALCGVGIGTWLVGAMSAYFAAEYGTLSLRYALTVVCLTLPFGAACAIMAGRTARPLEQPA